MKTVISGGELVVKCLEELGVKYIFGIPGAKVDTIFNALVGSKIKLILCRHEQNAAFIAAAYGRLTGKPGVVLVTSGPGVTNLTTGLLTATTEGYPIVAIGGNASQSMQLRQTHQSLNNAALMNVICKSSTEVHSVDIIPEVLINAFNTALQPTRGAAFVSIPQDILMLVSENKPIQAIMNTSKVVAPNEYLQKLAEKIEKAKQPILFLGMDATLDNNTQAIHELLNHYPMPVVSTFQAAGAVTHKNIHLFTGRVGLFKNEPGDVMLDLSDLIICVGFKPVEYDPELWNFSNSKKIIDMGYQEAYIQRTYHPELQILGDIGENLKMLTKLLKPRELSYQLPKKVESARLALINTLNCAEKLEGKPIHPLRFMYELKQMIDDSTKICCDVGTIYMWMARYFYVFRPHQLLFSNGQQTLGVALPWAMGCHFAEPSKKIISMSGDGGFLFSANELETAVREKIHFIHFIWRDGAYDMVKEQELMKYHKSSGVQFGAIQIPEFAKAFGAQGFTLSNIDDFKTIFTKAMNTEGPVLIDVPIDYSDNKYLFTTGESCS